MEKTQAVYIPPNNLHTIPGLEHFKPRTIRHLLFKAEQNGLSQSGAIVKIGRKILIDVARFFEWINNQRIEVK